MLEFSTNVSSCCSSLELSIFSAIDWLQVWKTYHNLVRFVSMEIDMCGKELKYSCTSRCYSWGKNLFKFPLTGALLISIVEANN